MASRYDFIKDVNGGSEYKIWRLKVRVIRLWRFANFQENNNSNVKPMIEMVVLDEQGGRIQCTVKSFHVYLFEQNLVEDNVYMISNLNVALNSAKFKPTSHEFRMFFKRETEVRWVEDSTIPVNAFCFVPYNDILNESNEERHLVDVVGLLSAKGDLIEFKRNGKVCNYLVIELDNLEGGPKLRCTLWEEFAHQLLRQLDKDTSGIHVIVLQFAKMKYFKVPEVDSLKAILQTSDENYSQPVTQLPSHVTLTAEEEFLNRLEYKKIAELKDVNQSGVYSTVGTIKEIGSEYNWCYRGCKKCSYGMKIDGNMFYCKNCNIHYSTFVTRYSIQVRVLDETDSASFMLFEKEAANFLDLSASELRLAYIARGGDKNCHPEEIDAFKENKCLFKVNVKIKGLDSIVPYVLNVQRLCCDEDLIAAFIKKHKREDVVLMSENSELLTQITDSNDVLKENNSMFVDNSENNFLSPKSKSTDDGVMTSKEVSAGVGEVAALNDLGVDKFITPVKSCEAKEFSSKNVVPLAEDVEMSSNKIRKIIKQEKID
ncbi:hypothetical protein SESBI_31349 [Sesbania bispinosa]|nr:hypothetical protein SESBI_31349 [Sesbania bispinosa]